MSSDEQQLIKNAPTQEKFIDRLLEFAPPSNENNLYDILKLKKGDLRWK